MKTTLRWIVSNLPLMLLALALASLTWVVAAEETDPTLTQRYSTAIPVVQPEPREGLTIVGEFNERVHVTLRAPQSVWNTLRVEDFEATIDLTDKEAGVYDLPVEIRLRKTPSEVISVEPKVITVRLEPQARRVMAVQVRVEGAPAVGYLTGTLSITPTQATVSGPQSYVDQVATISAQTSIQGASADIAENDLPLQALDSGGQRVPYIAITPATAQVLIPIQLSEEYRALTVRPLRSGQVASGYRITDITADPPAVSVRGTPDVIAALPGYIDTEPIDVEGARSNVIARPTLKVPANVVLVAGQQVTVTIFIEAIQSSMAMEITPTLQGLGPGLTATVSPATVEVFISGPLPQLEALKAEDVHVVLELVDLQPGTYQIIPQVVVPSGLTIYSVLPATVQVEILPAPTPPATASPTSEARS